MFIINSTAWAWTWMTNSSFGTVLFSSVHQIALGFRNVDCPVQWNGMAAGSFSGFACALHGRWHFKIIASAFRIVLNSPVELE